MTQIPATRSRRRDRADRRGPIGATLAGVALATVATIAPSADAGAATPRTSSAIIAEHAGDAVEALDRWRETKNPTDFVLYAQTRSRTAEQAEAAIQVSSGVLHSEWTSVSIDKQAALLNAISQLGVPYRTHTADPDVGFDCSGLTSWAFSQVGLDLPRISRDQINESESIDRDEAEAGDLVYYPGHVSIYLGAGTMVHSPNSGNHVEITMLPERSLRFGDAQAALKPSVAEGSLMDRAVSVTE